MPSEPTKIVQYIIMAVTSAMNCYCDVCNICDAFTIRPFPLLKDPFGGAAPYKLYAFPCGIY